MHLVQEDLDAIRTHWNTHRIRPSAGATCPPGIPDELYYLPRQPATDQLVTQQHPLPNEVLQQIEVPSKCKDTDFEAFLQYLCNLNNWPLPHDVDSAIQLYCRLLPMF